MKRYDRVRVTTPNSTFHGHTGFVTDVEDDCWFPIYVRLNCNGGVFNAWFAESELELVS